ncbi:MAG: Gfo/Idh/MocA family oxidoreductase [Pseudomonadota bacterium]
MSTAKTGVAVIGTGMASLPHGKSLAALKDCVGVHAVYSPSPDRRQRFADTFGFPAVDTVAQITGNAKVNTVLLLTPPNARESLVDELSAAGKHILMEKPVERTLQAATSIVERCESRGVELGIVFQHRFRDASLALQQHLPTLGAIHAVDVSVPWWREQSYYDKPGRGTMARDGGGVLISQAIHTLDLMLKFVGPVESVAAMHATTGFHQMECEDFVSAGLRFANGAVGSLRASTASYPGGTESMVIHGAKGSAALTGGELVIHYQNGESLSVGETAGSGGGADPMDFPFDWHQRLIERFLLDVNNGGLAQDFPGGRSSLAVHALIDALVLSGTQQRWVTPQLL